MLWKGDSLVLVIINYKSYLGLRGFGGYLRFIDYKWLGGSKEGVNCVVLFFISFYVFWDNVGGFGDVGSVSYDVCVFRGLSSIGG